MNQLFTQLTLKDHGIDLIFEKEPSLKEEFEKEKSKDFSEKLTDINKIMGLIKEILKNRSWNNESVNLLVEITPKQHEEWLRKEDTYLKAAFEFAKWGNGFSGNNPYTEYVKNFVMAIKTLGKEPESQKRLEIMLKPFPDITAQLEKKEIENAVKTGSN